MKLKNVSLFLASNQWFKGINFLQILDLAMEFKTIIARNDEIGTIFRAYNAEEGYKLIIFKEIYVRINTLNH